MRRLLSCRMILVGMLALVALGAGGARAEFPEKPITLVIPVSPGGSHDLHARGVAGIWPDVLGQPVLVKFVPGGAGMMGANFVVQARPDGYTILFSHNGFDLIVPQTQKVPFDPLKDLVTIAQINADPPILASPANRPWNTIQEFMDYAKKNPGKLNVAHTGVWGAAHFPTLMLVKAAGIKVTHIPHAGGGPALTAILAGDADAGFQFATQLRPLVRAGKVKGLLVAGPKRHGDPLFKDLPTMKELGWGEGFVMERVFYAPRKIPPERLQKLRESFAKLMKERSFLAFMRNIGEPIDLIDGEVHDKRRPQLWKEYGELIREVAGKK